LKQSPLLWYTTNVYRRSWLLLHRTSVQNHAYQVSSILNVSVLI
jgi:hypothetical protein